MAEGTEFAIVETIVQDSGVPNAVAGIIFRNRLYDTIFEVIVFTIAIMGAKFLMANETPVGPCASVHRSPIDCVGPAGSYHRRDGMY